MGLIFEVFDFFLHGSTEKFIVVNLINLAGW